MRRAMVAISGLVMAMAMAVGAARANPEAKPAPYGQQDWIAFLSGYQQLSPQQVLRELYRMPEARHALLGNLANLASDVYFRGCQADPTITFWITGSHMSCQMVWQDRVQAAQWVGTQAIMDNVELQRQQALNTARCATGAIDRQTCRAYFAATGASAAMMGETLGNTVHNLNPNACTVGSDPNCRPIN